MLGELVTTTGDLKTQLDTLAVEIKAEIKRTIEFRDPDRQDAPASQGDHG